MRVCRIKSSKSFIKAFEEDYRQKMAARKEKINQDELVVQESQSIDVVSSEEISGSQNIVIDEIEVVNRLPTKDDDLWNNFSKVGKMESSIKKATELSVGRVYKILSLRRVANDAVSSFFI